MGTFVSWKVYFYVNLKLPQGCYVLPCSLWYCLVFCNVYLCPLNVTVIFMSIYRKKFYGMDIVIPIYISSWKKCGKLTRNHKVKS